MSSYAEMARERKWARPLYLELRALGVKVYVEEDYGNPQGPVLVGNLGLLSLPHLSRLLPPGHNLRFDRLPRHFGG